MQSQRNKCQFYTDYMRVVWVEQEFYRCPLLGKVEEEIMGKKSIFISQKNKKELYEIRKV